MLSGGCFSTWRKRTQRTFREWNKIILKYYISPTTLFHLTNSKIVAHPSFESFESTNFIATISSIKLSKMHLYWTSLQYYTIWTIYLLWLIWWFHKNTLKSTYNFKLFNNNLWHRHLIFKPSNLPAFLNIFWHVNIRIFMWFSVCCNLSINLNSN